MLIHQIIEADYYYCTDFYAIFVTDAIKTIHHREQLRIVNYAAGVVNKVKFCVFCGEIFCLYNTRLPVYSLQVARRPWLTAF